MKRGLSIRAQNAIWILPLFLVLSGVSAWASYKAIKQDLMWSFREEARSLAIAIAELVDRDELAALIAQGEEDAEAIATPIKRLRRWGHLHRLSIYGPDGALAASYGGLQTVERALTGEQLGMLDLLDRVGRMEEGELEALRLRLQRSGQVEQSRRLSELLAEDGRSVWVQDIAEYLPEGVAAGLWRSLQRLLGSESAQPEPAVDGGAEGALLSAFAPVRRRAEGRVVDGLSGCYLPAGGREVEGGELVAWVRAETHVDEFVDQVARFQRKVLLQVLSSCLLGLVLVVLLTRIVAPKLRELAEAVEQVSTGRYGQELEEGSVREINDLANTFGTMVSVLRETVDKGRRSVMDREESRATSEIAHTWARRHLIPRTLQVGGFELAAMLGPEAPESSFVGLFGLAGEPGADAPAGFVGVIGSVAGDDPVTRAACSTAVPRFLEEHLGSFAPEQLLAEARQRFGVASARLVAWSEGDDRVVCLTLGGDGPIERRELSREKLADRGLLVQDGAGPSGEETLTTLTRWMAPFDAQGLITHLQRLVAGARRGGALYIRAREPGAG